MQVLQGYRISFMRRFFKAQLRSGVLQQGRPFMKVQRSTKGLLPEAVKVELVLQWRLPGYQRCQGYEISTNKNCMHGVEPVLNRSMLKAVNLEEQKHLQPLKLKQLISDKELQGFPWWLSVLPGSRISPTMAPFLALGMVLYSLCIMCWKCVIWFWIL